jgi:hypothetical protein
VTSAETKSPHGCLRVVERGARAGWGRTHRGCRRGGASAGGPGAARRPLAAAPGPSCRLPRKERAHHAHRAGWLAGRRHRSAFAHPPSHWPSNCRGGLPGLACCPAPVPTAAAAAAAAATRDARPGAKTAAVTEDPARHGSNDGSNECVRQTRRIARSGRPKTLSERSANNVRRHWAQWASPSGEAPRADKSRGSAPRARTPRASRRRRRR